jgi:simple sugar transport system permease protein
VTIGTTSVVMAVLSTHYHMPIPLAMLCSLVVAVIIGLVNGILVVKTRMHSFLVTLAMLFVLRGVNVAISLFLTGSVSVGGIAEAPGYEFMHTLFGSRISIGGVTFQVSILWWTLLMLILAWVLTRTRFGNWTQAIGGNEQAARAEGVPVAKVKISLFVITSCAAWLAGMFGALRIGSAQAGTGYGLELQFVVAAVMGGCLLFGGRGSIPGTFLGSITFGMLSFGITYSRWPGELYWLFLGVMLFFAVLLNTVVLRRVSGGTVE